MDFQDQLNNLIAELEKQPRKMAELEPEIIEQMNEEQVTRLRKIANPYGSTIQGSGKKACISVTNIPEEYYKKLHMTGLVAFLFRMSDEYLTDEYTSEVFVRRVRFGAESTDYSEDDLRIIERFYPKKKYLDVHESAAGNNYPSLFNEEGMCMYQEDDDHFNVRREILQREMDNERNMKRTHVKEFLNSLFEYNPDIHVRRSDENLDVKHLKTDYSDVEMPKVNASAEEIKAVEDDKVHERTRNIPNDVFYRYKFYMDVNYEKIMKAVDKMYSVCNLFHSRPGIYYAINVYDVFEDKLDPANPKTAAEQADEFTAKHQDEVIADILTVETGGWTVLESYVENRKNITFNNDKTAIMDQMYKRAQVDTKMGTEILNQRVATKKKENARREGSVHPNFYKHAKDNMNSAEAFGAKRGEDLDKEIQKMRELEEVDEDKALEIKVINLNAKTKTATTSYFYTKAEAPTDIGKDTAK